VNGIDITVAPHDQAVALLTGICGEISLLVSRDQQPTNQGASSTVTWPITPLEPSALPIIVQQPPTPNYAAAESPRVPGVDTDATDVAKDSSTACEDVCEPVQTANVEYSETIQPLEPDLMDFSSPTLDAKTLAREIELQQRTTQAEAIPFSQYADVDLDIEYDDDDSDLLGGAAAAAVLGSPVSSDIRDMIQQGLLETLRLL